MSSVALFLVAAGGVSAIIYWMMTRLGDPRPARRAYDSTGTDSMGGGTSTADGWSLSSLFGGDSSSSHNSGWSSDGGGGSDSGGGGDGGGGGGGGD